MLKALDKSDLGNFEASSMDHEEPPTNINRERLPNRRQLVRHRLQYEGHTAYVDIGFSPAGKPLEIFCSGLAAGSGLAAILNDFACVVSLALQYGLLPKDLAHSIGRVDDSPDKPASSICGLILDLLASQAEESPLV